MNKNNYDYSISTCRIVGSTMIIICHIGTALNNSVIGQSFQVGVQLFLLISGYLYGQKTIKNKKSWIQGRFLRICVPVYIYVAVMATISLLENWSYNPMMLPLVALNLQGYHHIFTQMPYWNPIPGTAHLWFITSLVICYTLTLVVQHFENCKKLDFKKSFSLLLALFIFTIVLGLFGIRIDYALIYFVGYFYARRKQCWKDYVFSIICLIIGLVLRVASKLYCDIHGDTLWYLYTVIPLSYSMLAFWLFKTIYLFKNINNSICKNEVFRKVILFLDGLSFYIYITHYQFIDGPFSVMEVSPSISINIVIALICTFISACILKEFTSKIILSMQKRR